MIGVELNDVIKTKYSSFVLSWDRIVFKRRGV